LQTASPRCPWKSKPTCWRTQLADTETVIVAPHHSRPYTQRCLVFMGNPNCGHNHGDFYFLVSANIQTLLSISPALREVCPVTLQNINYEVQLDTYIRFRTLFCISYGRFETSRT
jgi:hypothetical protein